MPPALLFCDRHISTEFVICMSHIQTYEHVSQIKGKEEGCQNDGK
jgi:hypothetical protein